MPGSKTFSLKARKKAFLTVELMDGEKILVRRPTKAVADAFSEIKDADEADMMDLLYAATSFALSNNMQGKEFTVNDLEKTWDIDDIYAFYEQYGKFVRELESEKH